MHPAGNANLCVFHHDNQKYQTKKQLWTALQLYILRLKGTKALQNVTCRGSCKGFNVNFKPDSHWSCAFCKALDILQLADGRNKVLLNRDKQAVFQLDTTYTQVLCYPMFNYWLVMCHVSFITIYNLAFADLCGSLRIFATVLIAYLCGTLFFTDPRSLERQLLFSSWFPRCVTVRMWHSRSIQTSLLHLRRALRLRTCSHRHLRRLWVYHLRRYQVQWPLLLLHHSLYHHGCPGCAARSSHGTRIIKFSVFVAFGAFRYIYCRQCHLGRQN